MNNATRKVIEASLEGMKVAVSDGDCVLHEYNFETNTWHEVERRTWPVPVERAERWLRYWNKFDHNRALRLLVDPRDL